MKRSEALAHIKHCGYHNDTEKAAMITMQNGIGKAASTKAFLSGTKAANLGIPCDCPKCKKENKQ
jgi:hypothetical protein